MTQDVWERLDLYLDRPKQGMLLYVYRLDALEKPIKPYLLCCSPYPDLLEDLRDVHGGGDFRILIREGRTMIFRGDISIGQRLKT
jgi:hypothetical protein